MTAATSGGTPGGRGEGIVTAMSLEELEQRVTTLESEVGVLRQETAAARALAAGADRDVADYRAELRGHTRTLNALRDTQVEQGHAITALTERVGQLTGTVNHIRDQHGASLAQIVGLLNHLIERDGGPE
jgi:chromosome segregation ATPase